MKILFKTVLILVLCHAPSFAGTTDMALVTSAGERLGQGLSELKNSVVRLDAGNQALAAANTRLKVRLDALRLRLRDLSAQEDQMGQEAAKLKLVHDPDSKRIARLEKELSGINAKLEIADPIKQKGKLKILKMIYDSKKTQEQLNGRIFEARKDLPHE